MRSTRPGPGPVHRSARGQHPWRGARGARRITVCVAAVLAGVFSPALADPATSGTDAEASERTQSSRGRATDAAAHGPSAASRSGSWGHGPSAIPSADPSADPDGSSDGPSTSSSASPSTGASAPDVSPATPTGQAPAAPDGESTAVAVPTTAPSGPTSGTTDPGTAPSTQAPTPAPATAAGGRFPTAATTGVPAGWQPSKTVTGDYVVSTPGAVVEDLRITGGTLYVRAPGVTLRRVEVSSGQINNYWSGVCYDGLRIEDTTIVRGDSDIGQPAIQHGGYTAVRVKIDGTSEGLRLGAKDSGCGDTLVEDSWIHVTPYDDCVANQVDWHGDGLQGYQGASVTVRNSYVGMESVEGCIGNAAIFYPDQGNTRITLDHVLASGGGFTVRIETPGTVNGLKVVDDSWRFGPTRNNCDLVTWGSGNAYVKVAADGSTTDVAPLPCSGW